MTYQEARTYIGQVSKTGSILGLESIRNLMNELGNVQDELSIIHIAGTNGKGSTGAFLESALIEAGKKVGRYTSPAVFESLEVWRINRKNITEVRYTEIVSKVKDACDRMTEKGMAHPTVFEVETAMAFLYFYEEKCDYVLLEVGMGGETDATNLIKKTVCYVITSISMDHMQFLGQSLGEIAGVKAGIIKDGCPVVTVHQKNEAMQAIEKMAQEKKAQMLIADAARIQLTDAQYEIEKMTYFCPELGCVEIPLVGSYQLENSYLAIVVLKEILHIDTSVILQGLKNARWPGRFETIMEEPLFIIDGAHNEDAAEKLAATVRKYFTNKKITYIIGVLADKEHEKMLKIMLPLAERVFTVTPPNARALDGASLAEEAKKYHPKVCACESVAKAAEQALAVTAKDEMILAFGSLSYLGELKQEVERLLE